MRSAIETGGERTAATLPGLGHDFYTSPSPAVAGTTTGSIAWTGSDNGEKLARALGLFSIGLGLTQLLAPRHLARWVGLKPTPRNSRVFRFLGLREIGTGIAILAYPRPRAWIAARIAGDLMDLALLGKVMAAGSKNHYKTTSATLLVLGVTTLDIATAELLTEARKTPTPELAPNLRETPIHDSITVEAPVEEVYAFWHDPTNFPLLHETLRVGRGPRRRPLTLAGQRPRWGDRGMGGGDRRGYRELPHRLALDG